MFCATRLNRAVREALEHNDELPFASAVTQEDEEKGSAEPRDAASTLRALAEAEAAAPPAECLYSTLADDIFFVFEGTLCRALDTKDVFAACALINHIAAAIKTPIFAKLKENLEASKRFYAHFVQASSSLLSEAQALSAVVQNEETSAPGFFFRKKSCFRRSSRRRLSSPSSSKTVLFLASCVRLSLGCLPLCLLPLRQLATARALLWVRRSQRPRTAGPCQSTTWQRAWLLSRVSRRAFRDNFKGRSADNSKTHPPRRCKAAKGGETTEASSRRPPLLSV